MLLPEEITLKIISMIMMNKKKGIYYGKKEEDRFY